MGFYIGITGFIAKGKRGEALRSFVADVVPLDKLMVETDAPFMAPDRDPRAASFVKKNEPCTLPLVVETLAELYGIPPETLAKQTTANAKRFFKLP